MACFTVRFDALVAFPALFLSLFSASAFACPDLAAEGRESVPITAPEQSIPVEGIGGLPIEGCADQDAALADLADVLVGHLPAEPTAVVTVTQEALETEEREEETDGETEAETQSGLANLIFSTALIDPAADLEQGLLRRCDTVMLIQSPDGALSFSDDGGSANLSLLSLPRLVGDYKIWVGAFSADISCEGEVRVASADLPCPSLDAESIHRATEVGERWTVTAGGPRDIRGCIALNDLAASDASVQGFIEAAPTLTIPADLPFEGDEVAVSVSSLCDTVLVGRDGAGNWSFSDDAGDTLNPRLTFAAGFGGARIWVGSYDIAACDVDLSLGQFAETVCPDPNLPASASSTLGAGTRASTEAEIASDASVDLSNCASSLNGFEFSGHTSANPALSILIDDEADATSLSLDLSSTCTGRLLTHFIDANGDETWEMLSEVAVDQETLPVPGAGTYAFWLVSDMAEACAGSLTVQAAGNVCPDPALAGKETHAYGLADLVEGQRLPLIAGGYTDIATCTIEGLSASGTYIDRPDFVIEIEGDANVVFEGEGQCDTTLLVHDGNGTWHYSDDDAPEGNGGFVSLTQSQPGPYQVWVGTFGDDLCEGALLVKRGLFKE